MVLALVGESGAGKTLTLRLIAGLERPDRGRVTVDGDVYEDVAAGVRRPAHLRHVGYVPQDYALFPHLSVFENVAFGLRAEGARGPDLQRRVDPALARFELTDFRARRPGQLSGGQQQRVALARALVLQPRVLLLDEPLSSLDPRTRGSVREELARLLFGLSCATLYVTHDHHEARAIASQALVLSAGRAARSGPPERVL